MSFVERKKLIEKGVKNKKELNMEIKYTVMGKFYKS